jgi:hypothetical protein
VAVPIVEFPLHGLGSQQLLAECLSHGVSLLAAAVVRMPNLAIIGASVKAEKICFCKDALCMHL